MKGRIATLAIVLLAAINVATFLYVAQYTKQLDSFKKTVDEKTNKIVYIQSKDGYTPVKGIDYFDGTAGINAVSFSRETTVIKEVPLIGQKGSDGKDGKDGKDAPLQLTRVNQQTKDIEIKYTGDDFWDILVLCADYRLTCPEQP